MGKVLGVSAFFHDSAAAVVVDGQIVAAVQEERLSRIKHDKELPTRAAELCLAQAGLSPSELDHVVFYEKPLAKFDRILAEAFKEFPRARGQFRRSMRSWLGRRLWTKSEIARRIGCSPRQVLFSRHHISHAASAFFCSPFDRAAVITADGVGERTTTAIFAGESSESGCRLDPVCELRYPGSIGLLYSTITAFLGFEVNEGEYKVMGLASYGQPRYLAELERICHIADDASLELDLRYFAFHRSPTRSFTKHLEQLLGPARTPGAELDLDNDSDAQRFADIAASVQLLLENYMLRLASEAKKRTGADALCLAGGVALNAVANGRLHREGPFEELFVQPAAGDAGGSLGAALYVDHVLLGTPRQNTRTFSPYLGGEFSAQDVELVLNAARADFVRYDRDSELLADTARRLADGQVCGWFQGRFEWGPRALGARSILADPRVEGARDRINAKVKFREPFRPFAPAVLEDERDRWFDAKTDRRDLMSPYMCTVMQATETGRREIPAVVHVDGTARLQSVGPHSPPRFEGLLREFRSRTGVGVLLNTSMNLNGEPIVSTPAEAYSMFLRSELDFLVLEDCVVTRKGASHVPSS